MRVRETQGFARSEGGADPARQEFISDGSEQPHKTGVVLAGSRASGQSPLVTRRTTCRICHSGALELVLSLAPTPIAGLFLQKPEPLPVFPLVLALCRRCGLVQLLDTVDPVALYTQTTERTARDSPGMAAHFQRYAEALRVFQPNGQGFAVEIGSNDGCFSNTLRADGWLVCGVDPCQSIPREAGFTIRSMFSADVAKEIRTSIQPANLIVANNVLANVDDLGDFAEGIKTLLAPNGVFVFETGYLGSLVEHLVFDNIYHEHLSYFSVVPLIQFFADHGLALFDVEVVNTKGGSLRGFVQHYHGPRAHTVNAASLLAKEEQQELLNPWTYRAMGRKLAHIRETLRSVLPALAATHTLAGYGASHSVVTLAAHFDIAQYLRFVVDDNPVKQGMRVPGTELSVCDPLSLQADLIDFCVILPWRFADQIVKKHQAFREAGGRFIVPVPEVRFV